MAVKGAGDKEGRTLCCSYLHCTCCGYPRKSLRQSLAVTLGSSNLPSTQNRTKPTAFVFFPCLQRSEIPAEVWRFFVFWVFFETFLHLVLSLLRRQQEVILPSHHQPPPLPWEPPLCCRWGWGAVGSGFCSPQHVPMEDSPPASPELAPNPGPRGWCGGGGLRRRSLSREKSERWETRVTGMSHKRNQPPPFLRPPGRATGRGGFVWEGGRGQHTQIPPGPGFAEGGGGEGGSTVPSHPSPLHRRGSAGPQPVPSRPGRCHL